MKLVILDVDDTLFSWLTMWGTSFEALLSSLGPHSQQQRAEHLVSFRGLHKEARTSERGLSSSDAVALGVEPSAILRLAAEFEDSIMRHTRPFDGVLETLAALRSRGVMVVAHTDTSERLAADRLVLLGLDGLVETLFTTDASQVTAFRSVHRWPERTEVVVLPYLKPDPRGVAAILERCGASRDECVYVGDSKAKDITLARNAGVRDVFAAYGCLRDTPTYDLLRSVSHWTDEDIVRENALRASASTEATHTLSSFRELLELL